MMDTSAAKARDPDTMFADAVALHQAGRLAEAFEVYRSIVAAWPGHAATHRNLGVLLRRLKRWDEALASYGKAIALDPEDASAYYNRGNLLADLQRPAEAIADYDRALAIQPGSAVVEASRANALRLVGRLDEALQAYDQALGREPELAFAHNGRGATLFTQGRAEEALAAHDRAIAADPAMVLAHRNRGYALWKLRRYEDAIASYDRAAELDPADAAAPMFRGLSRLTLGRFADGWSDYERRWEVEEVLATGAGQATPGIRARFRPLSDASELAGRDVLIVGEQGVGDVIMFASLIPELAATARRVSLYCDARLHRLFAHSFPGLRLLDAAAVARELSAFEVVMGIGGLARLYRNRREDFPGTPYLRPAPGVRERWAERLGPAQGRKRIGISWRGGAAATRREERSVDLEQLQAIFDLPGCEIVSLQYGVHDAEIARMNARQSRPLRQFPPHEIDDFEALAGLIGARDLVVTVQTTLVHLTGACGAPGLVLIPTTPEWRYGASAPTMPWYRSISLLRQQPGEDWAPVIRRAADQAAHRLGTRDRKG